jgi:hypothetical protein
MVPARQPSTRRHFCAASNKLTAIPVNATLHQRRSTPRSTAIHCPKVCPLRWRSATHATRPTAIAAHPSETCSRRHPAVRVRNRNSVNNIAPGREFELPTAWLATRRSSSGGPGQSYTIRDVAVSGRTLCQIARVLLSIDKSWDRLVHSSQSSPRWIEGPFHEG